MNRNNPEDQFDSWLAQELRTRQPYLDDAGFSDRVMDAVPASAGRAGPRAVLWSLLLALVTALVTWWLFPGWTWLATFLTAFLALPLMTLLLIGLGMGLTITALAGVVIWQSGGWR